MKLILDNIWFTIVVLNLNYLNEWEVAGWWPLSSSLTVFISLHPPVRLYVHLYLCFHFYYLQVCFFIWVMLGYLLYTSVMTGIIVLRWKFLRILQLYIDSFLPIWTKNKHCYLKEDFKNWRRFFQSTAHGDCCPTFFRFKIGTMLTYNIINKRILKIMLNYIIQCNGVICQNCILWMVHLNLWIGNL